MIKRWLHVVRPFELFALCIASVAFAGAMDPRAVLPAVTAAIAAWSWCFVRTGQRMLAAERQRDALKMELDAIAAARREHYAPVRAPNRMELN